MPAAAWLPGQLRARTGGSIGFRPGWEAPCMKCTEQWTVKGLKKFARRGKKGRSNNYDQ